MHAYRLSSINSFRTQRVSKSIMTINQAIKHFIFNYIHQKMVAMRKQNKNLTNLTKMLRNSPQLTTIIQHTEHHHTHTAVYNEDCHTNDNYLEIY